MALGQYCHNSHRKGKKAVQYLSRQLTKGERNYATIGGGISHKAGY